MVFSTEEAPTLRARLKGAEGGSQVVHVEVADYFGLTVWQRDIEVAVVNGSVSFDIQPGLLGPGYYEVRISTGAAEAQVMAMASVGIAPFVDRTAEEAAVGGYRFGMKMWGPTSYFDSYAAMDLCARLGLQWTRESFDRTARLAELPLNVIMKIERFPLEAYDEARYGPREAFRLRYFKWDKATLPLEEPYKRWLRHEVAKLPVAQNHFEIWNEPWGKLPAPEFAKVAQWTKDIIREARPDAVVGPNLGQLGYDGEFITAGGMAGMNALYLHPYGHPERSDVRGMIRSVREFYLEHLGKDVPLYVTEFGVATPPAGPDSKASEHDQARLAVRASLAFYAEGVEAFMPHVLASAEKDPRDGQHWYGYFRRNAQPKPGLIALATAARMIDGSRYVGDLFYRPDVGAMVFERSDGRYVLVLWTNDLTLPVLIDTKATEVEQVNIVGASEKRWTQAGQLELVLTGDPIYLVGVGAELAREAKPDGDGSRWVTGRFVRQSREAHRMKTPPVIDGRIGEAEWRGQTEIEMKNQRIAPADASAMGYVAWDKTHLYLAAQVRDDHPYFNLRDPVSVYDGDCLEVWLCSQPARQIEGFLHTHDFQLLFAPTSASGKEVVGRVDHAAMQLIPIEGVRYAFSRAKEGWAVEIALPLSAFPDFPGELAHTAALEMRVDDVDPTHARFQINPAAGSPSHRDATRWSYLKFVE